MENNKMMKVTTILFFGSLWGLLEATLGYALQFLPFFVSGMIMFPLAVGILISAYLKTQSRMSLLWIGIIAVAIKSVNLFMPLFMWRVVNPMVAILLETLLIVAVANVIIRKPLIEKTLGLVVASIGWRSLYLVYMIMVPYLVTGFLSVDLSTPMHTFRFIYIQGMLGVVLSLGVVYGVDYVSKNIKLRPLIHPVPASVMFVLAIVLTLVL